jgi:hypothetical protein
LPDILDQPKATSEGTIEPNYFGVRSFPHIEAEVAARAPADGYTLPMVSIALAISETMSPKGGYQLMREFTPITQLNALSLVLVANPKLPVKSVAELIGRSRSPASSTTPPGDPKRRNSYSGTTVPARHAETCQSETDKEFGQSLSVTENGRTALLSQLNIRFPGDRFPELAFDFERACELVRQFQRPLAPKFRQLRFKFCR